MALAALFLMIPMVSAEQPVNVVLLSVDTLRAGSLGCYGYGHATSPNIDAFAEGGVLFEDAICEVPLTNPSMGSMMSSRYPRVSGTTRNGLSMPSEVPLVPELFVGAGYETYSVQSNWTLKKKLSGLDRGFETYDENFHTKRWGVIKAERPGDEVTDIALGWLSDRNPDRPFFAWIHYSDPHAPYKMHRAFNPSGKKFRDANKEENVRIRYDSEVAYTDGEIGRLLAALPDNTAVLFVGDHGESLFEHDYLGHGRRVYQASLHIPLIVRAPGLTGGRRSTPVRGIDVGPTLLGLAGLGKAPGMLGRDILGEVPSELAPRIVETYGGAVPKVPGVRALMANAEPMWQTIIDGGWKLIVNGRRTELYHLAVDPGEEENLARDEGGRVEILRGLLGEWDRLTERGVGGEEDLNDADIEALRSLGYID